MQNKTTASELIELFLRKVMAFDESRGGHICLDERVLMCDVRDAHIHIPREERGRTLDMHKILSHQ